MDANRFDRLSDGQKECLRLFHARWEVKDIARRLGRSPVTVHQRLAAARKHLGVDRSAEAARLLFDHENADPATARPVPPAPARAPADTFAVAAAQAGGTVDPLYSPPPYGPSMLAEPSPDRAGAVTETPQPLGFPLPFPTRDRPVNDLSFGAKLLYVVGLAALIALVFGGTVAALSGLSELF
jgi:DNA-binding CsgD family transcriptional regulator